MRLKEKKQIIAWLDKYNIQNYTLRPDETYGYIVDVEGIVSLEGNNLMEISVKFGVVSGDFDCSYNFLTSLEGSPDTVDGSFYCEDNQLTSLEGSPHTAGGYFDCRNNQLISLQTIPESVGGYFYCNNNQQLGELQDITNFKTIQAYLLAEKLSNELNTKDNKKKIKL